MKSTWRQAIDERFSGREELRKLELARTFWPAFNEAEVCEALEAVESECDVSVGLMRPDDGMKKLFEPPKTRNPFKWMEFQVHGGDSQFELQCRLEKKRKLNDANKTSSVEIRSLDDFVHAWCGAEFSDD